LVAMQAVLKLAFQIRLRYPGNDGIADDRYRMEYHRSTKNAILQSTQRWKVKSNE